MKKSSQKKLKSICNKPMSDVTYADMIALLHDICPPCERFKSACMCDNDWWYVVQYTEDTDKNGVGIPLVIIKSYNRKKGNYVYRCMECSVFYYMLCLTTKSLEENEIM